MALTEGNHMVALSTHSAAQIRVKLAMTCDITPESCSHNLCSNSAVTLSIFNMQYDFALRVFLFQFSEILYKLNQDC